VQRIAVYRGVPTYSEQKIRSGDLVVTSLDMATRYAGPHGVVVSAYIPQQELEFYQQGAPGEIEYRYIGERMRGVVIGKGIRMRDVFKRQMAAKIRAVVGSRLRETHESNPLADLFVAADARYPIAGEHVDGLYVRDHVPNLDSIDGYFANSKTLPGIRVVPMSDLGGPRTVFYATDDFARSERLAEAIRTSGEISPLIIGVDEKGPFVIEGAHRFVALWYLKARELPAVVVVEED